MDPQTKSDVTTVDPTTKSDVKTENPSSKSNVTTVDPTTKSDVKAEDPSTKSNVTALDSTTKSDVKTENPSTKSDATTVEPTTKSDVKTENKSTKSDVTTENVSTTPNVTSANETTWLPPKATNMTSTATLTTDINNTRNCSKSGTDTTSSCHQTYHMQVANICLLSLILIVVLGIKIYHTKKCTRRRNLSRRKDENTIRDLCRRRIQNKMEDNTFRMEMVSDAKVGSSSFQAARDSCSRVILKPSGPTKIVKLMVNDNEKKINEEPSIMYSTPNTNIRNLKWHHINSMTETYQNILGNIFTNEICEENNNNEIAMSHGRKDSHLSAASQSPILNEICDSLGDKQSSRLKDDEFSSDDSFTESSCTIHISPNSSGTNSPTWSLDIQAPAMVDWSSQSLTKEESLPMPPSQLPNQASGYFSSISSHCTNISSRPASTTLSHLNSTQPLLPRKQHIRKDPSSLPPKVHYPKSSSLPEPPNEMPFKPLEDPLPAPPDCLPFFNKVSTLSNTFHQIKKPHSCPSIPKQFSPLFSIRTAQRSVSKHSLSSQNQCSLNIDSLPMPPKELPLPPRKPHDYITNIF